MAGDETDVRAKAPVPKDVFSPTYNQVDNVDHTDTAGTVQPSKFQTEAWSRDDGKVAIPSGARVVVDGREVDGDKVVIKHADVVNIYQGGGDRSPQVAQVEDNGDYIGTNYPEYNRGPHRIGHLPYNPQGENPLSYHAMLRQYGNPDIVFNANIGGDRNCGNHHFRHPRHEFGYRQDGYPGTPPFFPPTHGGPRVAINIGGPHGGGLRIGGVDIGGRISFPIGGNNDGFRPNWGSQPSFDISANINTGSNHHMRPHHENFHESQQNARIAANRQRAQERMAAAREQLLTRRHQHGDNMYS